MLTVKPYNQAHKLVSTLGEANAKAGHLKGKERTGWMGKV